MNNRSPRNCNPLNPQTPPVVGPTTYIVCDGRDKRVNTVPFLSSEKKVPKFFTKASYHSLYDISTIPRNIVGGSTLRNRSVRFVHKVSDTPAPGDYDPKIPGKCKRLDPTPIEGKGKLYVCSVPYTVHDSAPSIPTEINANGYYSNAYGDIKSIPPNKHDTTLGPAFYTAKSSHYCYTYRGCKWSQRTAERDTFLGNDNPGPGKYDPQLPNSTKDPKAEEYREMARLFTFLPRFIEDQQLKFQRAGLPGPADYDIRNCSSCKICPGIYPKPLISKSERFKRTISDTPAPDLYEIVEEKYSVSKKHIPFFVQSSRFAKKSTFTTPAPGDYEIISPITEKLMSKKNKFVAFEPPFNKTSPRTLNAGKKDAEFEPSPAEYTLDAPKQHCKILPSSMFKSKVKRFSKFCRTNEVSPAHYGIEEPYNFTRNPQSHNVYEISFNALAKKGTLSKSRANDPGPADYMKQSSLSTKAYYFPVSPRFEIECGGTPGPGTYHIHPAFRTSTYKAIKTHNLHIKESVLKKKLRRHPNETYAKWEEKLQKRKKLRWFVEGNEAYARHSRGH